MSQEQVDKLFQEINILKKPRGEGSLCPAERGQLSASVILVVSQAWSPFPSGAARMSQLLGCSVSCHWQVSALFIFPSSSGNHRTR